MCSAPADRRTERAKKKVTLAQRVIVVADHHREGAIATTSSPLPSSSGARSDLARDDMGPTSNTDERSCLDHLTKPHAVSYQVDQLADGSTVVPW